MRYLLLPGLLLLFSRLSAQEPYFDYVLSDYHARINAIAWQGGRILAGGSTRDCDRAAIWLFNRQGEVQWMRPVFEFGYSRVEAVHFDRAGDLLAAGYHSEADDYGTPDDGWRIEKLDKLGQSRFLTPLFRQTEEENPFETAVHLLDLPDGRYLVALGNRLAWLSPQGDSLFSRHYGDHYHVDLAVFGDSTLAVLAESDFSLLDLEGNLLQRFVHGRPLRALHVHRDTVWYASDTRLYYYHPGMNAPVSLPLAGFTSVIDLSADSTGLLLLGDAANGEGLIVSRHLPDDVEEARLPIDRFQTRPRQLLFTPDGYLLGGNVAVGCPDGACDYALGFIQRFPAFALPDRPAVDLALDRVEVRGYGPADTISTSQDPRLGTIHLISIPIFLEFTYYNGGQDTIRDYALGSQRLDGFNCAEYRFYRQVESTVIAPGARHTHPDVLAFSYYTAMGNFSLTGQFFVAAPNHRLDWTPVNNHFSLQLISRRENPTALPFRLNVYPNPASDRLVLDLQGTTLREAALLDMNGRLLQKWSSSPLLLNRRSLPAGFYILQVQTPLGMAARPVVLR